MADLCAQTVADARAEPGAADLRWEQAIAMGEARRAGYCCSATAATAASPEGWTRSGCS